MPSGEENPVREGACSASAPKIVKPRLLDQVKAEIRLRHYSIRTEQAYAQLAPHLALTVRRELELAGISLRVDEVYREHAQRTTAGLTVPRELHPKLAEALVQLYIMQGPVGPKDAFLGRVRAAWLRSGSASESKPQIVPKI